MIKYLGGPLILLMIIFLSACNNNSQDIKDNLPIETEYITLNYPSELEGKLTHHEIIQDNVVIEIFTGIVGEAQREIFRIYFNDVSQGIPVGYIIRDKEEIPVTYYVAEYEDEIFITDEAKETYYSLMDGFQEILNSIYENPQFNTLRYETPAEIQKVELQYWNVELPNNIYWEEIQDENGYRVIFYGFIQNTRIELYVLGWGKMEWDYSIGEFKMDEQNREIGVRIFDIPENPYWDEADYNSAYRMLESVNMVTDAIIK